MKKRVVLEVEEGVLKELFQDKEWFKTKVPPYSFAAKVYQLLDGVQTITDTTPQHLDSKLPDVEP